jgi:hypothetical protein
MRRVERLDKIMKRYRSLVITALLMLIFLASGCDENNNMMGMNGDPPGAGDPAACPCFTEIVVKDVAENTESQFRFCQFNIAEIALVEANQDFEAVCPGCSFGTSECFCKNPSGTTDELTQEEFNACAQILINVLEDVSHMCTPADS